MSDILLEANSYYNFGINPVKNFENGFTLINFKIEFIIVSYKTLIKTMTNGY